MNQCLISILWFIAVFAFIYFYQYFFVISKSIKFDSRKIPVEVRYMMSKFKLNMKKVNYRRLVNITSLITAFDVAFVYVLITSFIENVYLSLIFIVILLIPIIIITFNLVGSWCCKNKVFYK